MQKYIPTIVIINVIFIMNTQQTHCMEEYPMITQHVTTKTVKKRYSFAQYLRKQVIIDKKFSLTNQSTKLIQKSITTKTVLSIMTTEHTSSTIDFTQPLTENDTSITDNMEIE